MVKLQLSKENHKKGGMYLKNLYNLMQSGFTHTKKFKYIEIKLLFRATSVYFTPRIHTLLLLFQKLFLFKLMLPSK